MVKDLFGLIMEGETIDGKGAGSRYGIFPSCEPRGKN
jgi:hypothetical protein